MHIDDLVDLLIFAIASAPAGALFAEKQRDSMKQVCDAINRKLGVNAETVPMSLDEASRQWERARRRIRWAPIVAFAHSVPELSLAGARVGRRLSMRSKMVVT